MMRLNSPGRLGTLLAVSRLFAVGSLMLASTGCPGDDTGDAGDEVGDTSTGASTGTGTGGDPGECNPDAFTCEDPGPPPAGVAVPAYVEMFGTQTIEMFSFDTDCPVAESISLTDPLGIPSQAAFSAEIYYPHENGVLPAQAGGFGLVAFTHGNALSGDQYTDLVRTLTSRGLIVASIVGDGDANIRDRKVRLLCLAEVLLGDADVFASDGSLWIGTGELSGDYAFSGHSTGGAGAYLAAKDVLDMGLFPGRTLRGSLVFAPNPFTNEQIVQGLHALETDEDVFFVIIQGSGDGDTFGKAFTQYDAIVAGHQQGVVESRPRKALVWGYDFHHAQWGGKELTQGCGPDEKAVAMIETYGGAFVDVAFYGQPADIFFPDDGGTPAISTDVAEAQWPTFGEAKVFGTSSERVDAGLGYQSFLIDGFENGILDQSDSNLFVTVDAMDYSEPPNGGFQLFDNFHITSVGAVLLEQAEPGSFPSSIAWDLSCEAQEALVGSTSITFRIGMFREVLSEMPCIGEDVPVPQMRMFLQTPNLRANVDISDYARIEPPDARLEDHMCTAATAGPLPGFQCRALGSMQATARVPTEAFCGSGITLKDVTTVGVEFSSPDGRAILLDDLEITRVPGEHNVSCRCSPNNP
jgi:hypothetical protein